MSNTCEEFQQRQRQHRRTLEVLMPNPKWSGIPIVPDYTEGVLDGDVSP